jgi:hypothetical protein
VQSSVGILGYTISTPALRPSDPSIIIIGGLISSFLNSEKAHLYNSTASFGRKAKPIEKVFPEPVMSIKYN